MEVKQIYNIVNTITSEVLGDSTVVAEDLSNIVDVGRAIFNSESLDKYVRKLVDHIGKVIFVDRKYSGSAPSVLMDGWEYGAVLEKISANLPNATENESWELTDGASYDPNIFTQPDVSAKFFEKKTTFEIPLSIVERQAKSAFSNAEQMNAFLSMLYTSVDNSATVKTDELIMRTINNFIGETFYNLDSAGDYSTGNTSAVNLLALYNARYDESLTAENAITDPAFIRFAVFTMGLYRSRMSKMSKLFNMGSMARFTPEDKLHFVLLSDFASAANVFLQSDTFHEEFTKLPTAETVPYWQGSGLGYDFDDVSSINVTTASGHSVNPTGIIGIMFDRDALGVCNVDRRVTTNYNGKAEFWNNWYKFDASYFNDFNENFVVFYVA